MSGESVPNIAKDRDDSRTLSHVRRIALIGNPTAGRGRGRAAAETCRRVLEAAGCSVILHLPSSAEALASIAGQASADFDALVAVGGDGTLRGVLDGLRRPVSVGVIPIGTANVVARELGIPLDPAGAAALIARGRTRSLDLGDANGRRFLAMAGVGLDGEIVGCVHAQRSGPIRMSKFILPTWRACHAAPRARLLLSVDGIEPQAPFQDVIVCNVRTYGAYFSVTPDARPDDGRLDWVARPPSGFAAALAWAGAAIRRRPARFLRYGQATTLRIDAIGEPVAVQLDGDPAGTTPISLRVLPAAARLFVP